MSYFLKFSKPRIRISVSAVLPPMQSSQYCQLKKENISSEKNTRQKMKVRMRAKTENFPQPSVRTEHSRFSTESRGTKGSSR